MTCLRVNCRTRKQHAYATKHREEGNSYSIHVLILPVRAHYQANVIYSVRTLCQSLLSSPEVGGPLTSQCLTAHPSLQASCMCEMYKGLEGTLGRQCYLTLLLSFLTYTIQKSSTKCYHVFILKISTVFSQKCFFHWCLWNLTSTMIHSVNIKQVETESVSYLFCLR